MLALNLVGITGRKRSGKDTFADVLIREAGFERVAFADALKDDLARLLGVDAAYVEEHKAELRLALQLRGTEFWRSRTPDHWLHEADLTICRIFARGGKVVIPGVRFLNEAEFIRRRGGLLVRMIRTDLVSEDGHASEVEQARIEVEAEVTRPTGVPGVQAAARDFLATWGLDREDTPA